jgi:ribosomal protein S4
MPHRSQHFLVTPPEKGQTLAAMLKRRLELSWSNAKRLIEERRVRVNGQTCAEVARRLQPGMRVEVRGQRSEVRGQKSEVRGQKSEVRKRRTADL